MDVALVADALRAALGGLSDPAIRRWLSACADLPEPPPGERLGEIGAGASLEAIAEGAWRGRSRADRRRLGQVFTPRAVARQVLLELGGVDPSDRPVLDPAAGAGVFLAEAAALRAERHRALGWSPARIAQDALASVHGVDLDPIAVRLARLVLGRQIVADLGEAAAAVVPDLPLPSVRTADATDEGALSHCPPPGWVVGNPPYREAKGMPAEARARLRARFGDRLGGAFDVYLAFVWLALELVGDGGRIGFVLPNRVLVARYAASLRRTLLLERRLHALVDLSELDVFGRVGVYPVIVALGEPRDSFRASFAVPSDAPLGRAPLCGVDTDTTLPLRLADPPVWFALPDSPLHGLVERLAAAPRLSALAVVRSTCSFHASGLRERYVLPDAELPDGLPYLGGRSFARRAEIRPFRLDWQGYRIRFAAEELRALGNPLPPLALFLRPKVVICQHARRVTAWLDAEGRFVTKDVYPVVLPRTDVPEGLAAALAALLNSRVFSVLYALLYRGLSVGSGYLHFLPAFLHDIPIPALTQPRIAELAQRVEALQAAPERIAYEALDDLVSELYGLSSDERAAVRAFADVRLGFDEPLP